MIDKSVPKPVPHLTWATIFPRELKLVALISQCSDWLTSTVRTQLLEVAHRNVTEAVLYTVVLASWAMFGEHAGNQSFLRAKWSVESRMISLNLERRGSFGHQPGIFCVTQLMNYENIFFINLDRTFHRQFCVSFQNCFYSMIKTQLAVTCCNFIVKSSIDMFFRKRRDGQSFRRAGQKVFIRQISPKTWHEPRDL